MAAYAQNSLL